MAQGNDNEDNYEDKVPLGNHCTKCLRKSELPRGFSIATLFLKKYLHVPEHQG